MMLLMTGFPGFLGSALLPRLLDGGETTAVCIVQPAYADLAEQRLRELTESDPTLRERVRLERGDITQPLLGLDDPSGVAGQVTEIWHLAAAYDLAVPRDIGMKVNVEGTRYVLGLAESCPRLERLHYFSTIVVSGRYAGPFGEDDLEVGAPFNNFYEETKHLAEAEVRARMADGLPATIYRPAIVLGDSRTGETQKFDGLYFVLKLLLRQPRVAVLPVFGDPATYRANIVPRDYVIDATVHLSRLPQSVGRTYQLADPLPPTVDEWYDALAEATGRRVVRVPLPEHVTRATLSRIPGATALLGLPAELLDYFVHPTYYLTDHARADLAGTGIVCPPFREYAHTIVDYMRSHFDTPAAAMV